MIPFIKMHGLGNDFVVIDARERGIALSPAQLRAIGDRRRGVGYDQLIAIEPATNGQADAFFRFYNSDGSEAQACGNGTRCVAAHLMRTQNVDRLTIESVVGLLHATDEADGTFAVDQGVPDLEWDKIPLARAMDTLHLDLSHGGVSDPAAVGIGNPHCVFFVPDADNVDVAGLGAHFEHDPLFPERTNVEFASRLGENKLRMRVWERGAGITQACGSGTCAAAVAAHRRGLTGRQVEVVLDGGSLFVDWRDDGHVVLRGPVAVSYSGILDESLLT